MPKGATAPVMLEKSNITVWHQNCLTSAKHTNIPYYLFNQLFKMKNRKLLLCALALGAFSASAQHLSEAEMKQANDPMAHITTVNFHNYYMPAITGEDGSARANTAWVRVAQPVGERLLLRASIPISMVPTSEGPKSGLNDASIFGVVLASKKTSANKIGIGPMFVIPTSTDVDNIGSGKWQAGLAGLVFFAKNPALQGGGLVTWQTSIAGKKDKPDVSLLTFQPIGICQIGGGTYLRSAATWTFDLKHGAYDVPVGIGIGHVTKVGKTVFNVFIEPQYSVVNSGIGQPQFQLFAGINMQLL